MTREQLYNLIANYTEYDNVDTIMTAVDAYTEASNGAKPLVSGSLPLDDTLTESEYKESDAAFYENYGQRQ